MNNDPSHLLYSSDELFREQVWKDIDEFVNEQVWNSDTSNCNTADGTLEDVVYRSSLPSSSSPSTSSYFPTNTTDIARAWSAVENKEFEMLLAFSYGYPCERELTRWENIAIRLGRTTTEVEEHYRKLVYDVELIESDRVTLENYKDDDNSSRGLSRKEEEQQPNISVKSSSTKTKGRKWSEDEHRLFLAGVKMHGKGDWKSISRNFVTTRSATQVASHAQKYFKRQQNSHRPKARKRSSIHDITEVDEDTTIGLLNRGQVTRGRTSALQEPNINTGFNPPATAHHQQVNNSFQQGQVS